MAQFGVQAWLCDRDAAVVADALAWIARLKDNAVSETFQFQLQATQPGTAHEDAQVSVPTDAHSNSRQPSLADCERLVHHAGTLNELTSEALQAWHIDLILECVPEQISIKKRVLRQLSGLFPPPGIIASNSSYLVPSITSQFVSDPQRFAHMHFHVPVLRESVCDVVGCSQTSPEVLDKLVDLGERIGQPAIRLRREQPGYIFNWLLQSVLRGALELHAKDVADPADIDRAWKSVTGMPLGPFAIMDQIGLDVIEQVLSNARWAEASPITEDDLIAIVRSLVAAGKLGIKSGEGFYRYEE